MIQSCANAQNNFTPRGLTPMKTDIIFLVIAACLTLAIILGIMLLPSSGVKSKERDFSDL
jgi:hypothetical protein